MAILDFEVLDTISKKIIEHIKHQKDAQRNSLQKEVLNSSPLFFLAPLVKKTLMRNTMVLNCMILKCMSIRCDVDAMLHCLPMCCDTLPCGCDAMSMCRGMRCVSKAMRLRYTMVSDLMRWRCCAKIVRCAICVDEEIHLQCHAIVLTGSFDNVQ